jgi:hypothetical protein
LAGWKRDLIAMTMTTVIFGEVVARGGTMDEMNV